MTTQFQYDDDDVDFLAKVAEEMPVQDFGEANLDFVEDTDYTFEPSVDKLNR